VTQKTGTVRDLTAAVVLRGWVVDDPVRGDDGLLFLLATEASAVDDQIPHRLFQTEAGWCDVVCPDPLGRLVEASLFDGDRVILVGRLRVHLATHTGAVRATIEAITVGHDLSHGVARFIPAEQFAALL
jgi:single-stranded DNA-binding protein